jgi:hypothetical protein
MTPTQAINHIKFRFSSDKIIVNKKDIQAFNSVVLYIEDLKKTTVSNNKLLAKMIINEFIWQTKHHNKTSTSAISEIDRILKVSVWNWCLELKRVIPFLKLKLLSSKVGIIADSDILSIRDANLLLYKQYSKELAEAFTSEYSEDELESFVTNLVNELISNNENLD